MKTYFFDLFAQEVVTERDPYAAPERYLVIYQTVGNIYTDTYEIPMCFGGMRIDFVYSEEDSWQTNYDMWRKKLLAHLRQHKVDLPLEKLRLIRRGYPKQIFKKLLKEYKRD